MWLSERRRSSKRSYYGSDEESTRSNLLSGYGYSGFGASTNNHAYTEPVTTSTKELPIPRFCSSGVILMSDGFGGVKGITDPAASEAKDGRRIESDVIHLNLTDAKTKTFHFQHTNVEISNISALVEWSSAVGEGEREGGRPRIRLPFVDFHIRTLICQYMDGEHIEFRVVVSRVNPPAGQEAKLIALGRFDHQSSIATFKSMQDESETVLRCGENRMFICGTPLCVDKNARFNISAGDMLNIAFESNNLSAETYPTALTLSLPFNPL